MECGKHSVQFYVDDGLLQAISNSLELNCAVLAHIHHDISGDLRRLGLAIEASKYELLHFRRARTPWSASFPLGPPIALQVPGQPIVRVNPTASVRYLGFFLDPRLSFKAHIRFYATRAASTVNSLRMLGNSIRGMAPVHRRRLYISIVIPVMTYGAQLWWHPRWKGLKWALHEFQRAQSRAARWITGAFHTTPIGALEIFAGLVPIRHQIDKFMKKAALRVRTLPSSHPLRASLPPYWVINEHAVQAPYPLTGNHNTDAVTPLTHIDRFGRSSNEDFAPLHAEARPGDRLVDVFGDRITTYIDGMPPKGSGDKFTEWVHGEFVPRLRDASIDPDALLLFTDGSLRRAQNKWCSGAAFVTLHNARHVCSRRVACGTSSVFDAEMFALAMGIAHTLASAAADSVRTLHIYVDNKSAARAILDPSIHAAQMCAIMACSRLRTFLQRSPEHHICIHWCPSHLGIHPNEFVDERAKEALRLEPSNIVSLSAARSRVVERMHAAWRSQAARPAYRGHHLMVPEAYYAKLSHTSRGNPFLKAAGADSRLFARLTRFLTGHAPIGDFRDRFHLDGPVDCLCGHPTESIHHIVWECPLWIRNWDPRSRILEHLESLDPFSNILWFLEHNPMVATFEFADFQQQAQDELERGVRGGFYCNLLRTIIIERARVWYDTPGTSEERDGALAAFDAAQDDDD